ncbi:MAG TPA: hypothetical protein VNK24_09875 [Elusimicrobiota bacterium]|nr:hypothetical protein [Elusimicrobiota bacterium]
MAPVNNVVPAVNHPAEDAALVERAARRLIQGSPEELRQRIVDDLLAKLAKEKSERESRGLNHWENYAPRYLRVLVRSAANTEAWRRRRIDALFRRSHDRLLNRAERRLGSREEAQDAVSEAFVRTMRGKTHGQHLNRTLRDVMANRLRDCGNERKLFVSLDALMSAVERDESASEETAVAAFKASWPGEGTSDPVEILMDRRKRRAKPLMVAQAKNNKKMRRARRARWTDELKKSRPKQAARGDK